MGRYPITVAALACAVLASCLGGPGIEPRYFSATAAFDANLEAAQPDADEVYLIELQPVRVVGHLRERMVWRDGAGEVGFREDRRWSEDPAGLLARGLEAALAAAPGVGAAPAAAEWSLSVTLEQFGELRATDTRAEVGLRATLVDRRGRVVLQRQFSASEPVADDDPGALVRALGAELADQVQLLLAAVEDELAARGVARTAFR
ncbi:hypothetical protein Pla86_29010 [Planctomycetes bacterium Pla86]|uniref:ABC-type transport auxiliary lipoprotein component domain-containing protein n=2 Tax=Engelhardtia mirabilis TaxID=2528011 RepID=A0A518BLI1_9BACT|nr:hypothetical protein Pla133_29020 [Planctomycetes bacterium Pla133]QDV02139.1 hypothetical protein Pla86_29010 [Planctomycetes bacterium Pla86]